MERQLNRHILPALGRIDIRELHPLQIVELVQAIDQNGRITTAHDCLDIIRRICAHAVQLGIRETSPAAHLKDILRKLDHQPMKHVINPERLGDILLILDRAQTSLLATRAYIRLAPMLFTRPSELRTMKKRRVHLVPLPHQAQAILDDLRLHTGHYEHAFTNPASGEPISDGAAQRLKIRNGLHEEITWHGWRHTASTLLNEQGFNHDHIELQLSHVDKNTVRGTYNHAQYLDARRHMLQRWADYLDELKAQAIAREQAARNLGKH